MEHPQVLMLIQVSSTYFPVHVKLKTKFANIYIILLKKQYPILSFFTFQTIHLISSISRSKEIFLDNTNKKSESRLRYLFTITGDSAVLFNLEIALSALRHTHRAI